MNGGGDSEGGENEGGSDNSSEGTTQDFSGLQNSIDNQTQAINNQTNAINTMSNTISNSVNEVNETNKGVWGTLKSILDFINPLSKNFFVYKLIDLLVEALKALFVPSEEFINSWVSDLNDWLGQKLGVLYFPFEIVINFLTRVGEIAETNTAIIHIPQFDLNFMGYTATVFHEYTYNLNDILQNETYRNIHSIYLVVVDVVLWLGLVVLMYNTFTTIFGGNYMENSIERVENSDLGLKVKQKRIDAKKNKIGFATNANNIRRR